MSILCNKHEAFQLRSLYVRLYPLSSTHAYRPLQPESTRSLSD